VRAWVKAGLPTCDGKRLILVRGYDRAAFLQARRVKHKQTCRPGEIYCARCRCPKSPAGDMADYLPVTETIGSLVAICPDCSCLMNRRVNFAKLEQVHGKIDSTVPQALPRIKSSRSASSIGRAWPHTGFDLRHRTRLAVSSFKYLTSMAVDADSVFRVVRPSSGVWIVAETSG